MKHFDKIVELAKENPFHKEITEWILENDVDDPITLREVLHFIIELAESSSKLYHEKNSSITMSNIIQYEYKNALSLFKLYVRQLELEKGDIKLYNVIN